MRYPKNTHLLPALTLDLCYILINQFPVSVNRWTSIKPNPSREGDGKRRFLKDQDGRVAVGNSFGMLGFFILGSNVHTGTL
jgi:hypothetical protein